MRMFTFFVLGTLALAAGTSVMAQSPRLDSRPGESSDFEKEPIPKSEGEQRILDTLDDMWRGERFRNVSPSDGRLLRM